NSVLEATRRGEEISLHRAVGIDLKGQPYVRRADRRLNSSGVERPKHADDFVRLTVEQDAASDGVRIAAESPSPEAVAEDNSEAAGRPVFFRRKGTAKDR